MEILKITCVLIDYYGCEGYSDEYGRHNSGLHGVHYTQLLQRSLTRLKDR